MTRYWELKHEDGTDDAELYIFGDIAPDDWKWSENDRSAMDIVKAIEGLSAKNLIVHINSYGGDVKEGLAIYNCIKNCGMNVTTINDGFACSAASVIFMAGKQRVMNDASLLMIHNPYMMGSVAVATEGMGEEDTFVGLTEDEASIELELVLAYERVIAQQLEELKQTNPYALKEKLEDGDWVIHRTSELRGQIEAQKAAAHAYDERFAELAGGHLDGR